MKRLLVYITLIASACSFALAQDEWFPLPVPPETLPIGRQRANYMVEHYWDRCPWKSAYSNTEKMESQLRDFTDLLPLASADTAMLSIDRLIAATAKRPADLSRLTAMARATFHSDTAYFFSDQVYLPFAQAAAKAKKLTAEERRLAAAELQVLQNSMEGALLPDISGTAPDGGTVALNDSLPGIETYILIFEKPGADRFERILFAANISVQKLIDMGYIKPILILAAEGDEQWRRDAGRMPYGWTAISIPQAEEYFDLRQEQSVYLVGKDRRIISKLMPMRALTINCETLAKELGL